MIENAPHLVCNPDVIWDEVDGVLTLCETSSGEFFSLNDTGALIWKACAAKASFRQIVEQMADAYSDESTERLQMELCEFILVLRESCLLSGVGSGEG
jgi:hypothetical protein